MIKCAICNKCLKTFKGLSSHIRSHGISSKEYYDKYLRKRGEGFCFECGKETRYKRLSTGYCDYCSIVCRGKSRKVKEKTKQTCLKKYGSDNPMRVCELKEKQKCTVLKNYGVENPSQSDKIKEKKKQTCLNHYGVEHPSQSDEIKNKKKQTCLKTLGVEYPSQSKDVREKQKQTNMERYSVEHSLQSKTIMEKQKQTNMERYGTECPSSLPIFKEKTKQTNIKKYGVDNPLKLNKFKQKYKQTMLEKHGVENPNHFHIINLDKFEDVEFIKENFLTDEQAVKSKEMMEFFNIKSQSNIYLHLKKLNIKYNRMGGISHYEQELYTFLREMGIINIIKNDRQLICPKELDFYLPDYGLSIEFNGIFWHSEQQGKDKKYHLNKTVACEKKGVQLIHIFENEWVEKGDIVKSILMSKLGKLKKLCGARETKIKEIGSKDCTSFFNTNHIQGTSGSSIKLGAYNKNKLVSVMTFSRPSISKGRRDQKSNNYELSRFATVLNYNIPGMASKFLAYFKNNYAFAGLYTFADRRYSNGMFYTKLGFKYVGDTSPNYWYSAYGDIYLYHRFVYRKSELSKKLEIFDPKLTEYQNMTNNGYDRIWDCGNYKFVITCGA